MRPKVGAKIEVFKKFVEDCYERSMFKSSTPFDPSDHIQRSADANATTNSPEGNALMNIQYITLLVHPFSLVVFILKQKIVINH